MKSSKEASQPPAVSHALDVLRSANLRADAFHRFGEPCVSVEHAGKSAIISILGAQILAWTSGECNNPLWVTDEPLHVAGNPIRGGIPICWPWFGAAREPFSGPSHGTGRRSYWDLTAASREHDAFSLAFRLTLDEPRLQADYCIRVGHALELELVTTNLDERAWPVTPAFHPYFRVRVLDRARLQFAKAVPLFDRLVQQPATTTRSLAFSGDETELEWRPWRNVDLETGEATLRLSSKTATHGVAWNPGPEKTRTMNDLAVHAFREFVCVEPGQLNQEVLLPPDGKHTLSLQIETAD